MADSIPLFLQKLMKATGLTQTALAAHIGVTQGTVSKWIRQEHSPNTKQWDRVLEFARKNPKTRALAAQAPPASLDALVEPYGPKAEADARRILETWLMTLPKP